VEAHPLIGLRPNPLAELGAIAYRVPVGGEPNRTISSGRTVGPARRLSTISRSPPGSDNTGGQAKVGPRNFDRPGATRSAMKRSLKEALLVGVGREGASPFADQTE